MEIINGPKFGTWVGGTFALNQGQTDGLVWIQVEATGSINPLNSAINTGLVNGVMKVKNESDTVYFEYSFSQNVGIGGVLTFDKTSTRIYVPEGIYRLEMQLSVGAVSDALVRSNYVTIDNLVPNWFDEQYVFRLPVNRELTWSEGDKNNQIADERTKYLKMLVERMPVGARGLSAFETWQQEPGNAGKTEQEFWDYLSLPGITQATVQKGDLQFQILAQTTTDGTINITFDGNGHASISIVGRVNLHTARKVPAAQFGFTRLTSSGETKNITVQKGFALYLNIADAQANAQNSNIPDTAYTMTAGVANKDVLETYPTDKILLFSNWTGDSINAQGLFAQFYTRKMIADYLTNKPNFLTEARAQQIKQDTQWAIFCQSTTDGDVTFNFDAGGNAAVYLTGRVNLHTARKQPDATSAFTRFSSTGGSKSFIIPKTYALYLDIAATEANDAATNLPDSAYTMTAGSATKLQTDTYPTDKILLFSNWTGNLANASGLFADFLRGKLAMNAVTDARTKVIPPVSYARVFDKMRNFKKNFELKEKDIEILLLGDSIFGQTAYNSAYVTATQQSRPPGCICLNIHSGLWDFINDGSVNYSRWDKSGVFTESGSVWTSYFGTSLRSTWDDNGKRAAETRSFMGVGAANVAFTFGASKRRISWIYRTSTEGCATLTVSISTGNAQVEVWNGTAWVEANGYVFSQRYVDLGAAYGNTEFGRRLKFRKAAGVAACTINITKPVTATSEGMMYWGVEDTTKQFITHIRNAARGGFDMEEWNGKIRTEIDNFEPDLILFEIPIINMKSGLTYEPVTMWSNVSKGLEKFLFNVGSAYPNSLEALSNNFTKFEVVCCLVADQQSWYNSDGTLNEKTINGNV